MTTSVAVVKREPLVPFTVTEYAPGGMNLLMKTVRVEDPDPPVETVTLVALNENPRLEDEAVAVKLTTPEKPFRLATVTVVELDEPGRPSMGVGLTEMWKSGAGVTEMAIVTL